MIFRRRLHAVLLAGREGGRLYKELNTGVPIIVAHVVLLKNILNF